jgi:hypothetical protein
MASFLKKQLTFKLMRIGIVKEKLTTKICLKKLVRTNFTQLFKKIENNFFFKDILHFIKINKNSLFSRQVYLKLTQITKYKRKPFWSNYFRLEKYIKTSP